ncbi:MAG TPA: copper ion binding protein, partial [Pseudodesulfovibrio sp.]|nr:copper ion binding protein [Pseudodesulfovibrio sp.]
MKKLSAQVRGMHCASCSARIEKVVGNMDGVDDVAVNLAAETMALSYDPEAVSAEEVGKRIKGLGFEAEFNEPQEPVESGLSALDLDIGGMHCASCSSRIERVVGKLDGVDTAAVNLAAETGKFVFDPSLVSRREIRDAIANAGFSSDVRSEEGDLFEKRRQEAEERLTAQKRALIPAFCFALPLLILSMGHMWGMPLPAFL